MLLFPACSKKNEKKKEIPNFWEKGIAQRQKRQNCFCFLFFHMIIIYATSYLACVQEFISLFRNIEEYKKNRHLICAEIKINMKKKKKTKCYFSLSAVPYCTQ